MGKEQYLLVAKLIFKHQYWQQNFAISASQKTNKQKQLHTQMFFSILFYFSQSPFSVL